MKPDWDLYKKQADAYLKRDVFAGTSLSGEVLSESAKKTYEKTGKYIPVEFALAQAQRESSMGRKGRSPKNNPYNVGEFDEGTKIEFKNQRDGVQAYFDLIANDYLVDGKTTDDLMKNYVNKNGSRYASDKEYESYFQQQVPYIQKYLKKQTGFDISSFNPFSMSEAYAAEIPGENTMPQDPRDSLTMLQKLLTNPSVGKFLDNPGRASGEALKNTSNSILEALLSLQGQGVKSGTEAIKPVANAVGEFSQGALGLDSNTGTAQAAQQDPITKARIDTAVKAEKEQTQQMIASGKFTPEQVINFANEAAQSTGLNTSNNPHGQLGSAIAGQLQQVQPQQQAQEKPQGKNILDKLYERFQIGMEAAHGSVDPNYVTRQLQKQELEQGGKLGIELKKAGIDLMKENQKVELKRRDEFLKSMTDPLTAETAKSLSQVESALTGIDNMTNILGIQIDDSGQVVIKNEALLRDINFLNKNRQALIRARDNFINKALRRDTGAAIGKEEEKQFKKVYGFDIGIGAFMKNPEVIAKSILESKDQLTRDRNRLAPNEKLRSQFQALQQQGFSVDEIYEAYRKRGVL